MGRLRGRAKKAHTRLQKMFKEVRKEMRNKSKEELPSNVETMFAFLEKLGYNPTGANFKEFLGNADKGSVSEKYALEVFDRNIKERRSALQRAYKAEIKDKSYDFESERKRRTTFNSKFGIAGDDYDRITDLLGSDTFVRLKEQGLLDSGQLIDLSYNLTKDTDSKIMENVLSMIAKDDSIPPDMGRLAVIDALEKLGLELGKKLYEDKIYDEQMFKLKLHSKYNFRGDDKHM